MSAEDNKQAAKDGYAAFSRGDAEEAMANISDSIEWIVGGDNAATGTYNGKQEVGGFWAQISEKGFQTNPHEFIAEGDKVIVLTTDSLGGDQEESVDVLSYDDSGQLARFESFGGTDDLLNKALPR
jgi:uncharacterized protein